MQYFLGWLLIIFPGILYVGQVVSSINFPLAQRLGLQENPDESDPLLQRAERYAAYWDLLTLVWMPLSGVLMVLDNPFWPIISLFAGAIYLDTAGREAAKNLSLKHEGVRVGSPTQQKLFFSTYILMALLALLVLIYAINELLYGT